MPEFEVNESHLEMLNNDCQGKKKINLNTLKAITKFYHKQFPSSFDYNFIIKTNKENIRKKFTELLCKNYHKLFLLVKKKRAFIDDLSDEKKPPIVDKKKSSINNEDLFKPPFSDNLKSSDIKINIKPVDKDYLKELKKKINAFENNEYNIKKFEEDIKNDDFIKKAIDAHIKALEYKYKIYEKLSLINWMGANKAVDNKKEFGVDLNQIILDKMKIIKDKLQELNSNPITKNIKNKRNDFINILYNKDNGISTLQGTSRENIKISLIKNIYMFLKIPHFFFKGFNNFLLTGSAGSGKTKLASVIAFMMNNMGILATNNLVIATKQNLIGEFIGQSAPKTRNLLANALEGVVFIDEAYTLTSCDKFKKDSFSEEAIGELINFIDKFIGCLVIIVAGYKDKMNDCFLTFNEGIARRFPKIIDLIPYSSKDMYKIFETFLNESIEVSKIFTKKQREYMKSIISALNEKDVFNNQAGDMLNLSKVIGEDAILFDDKYNNDMIKYSFMKFCATKNIAIDF